MTGPLNDREDVNIGACTSAEWVHYTLAHASAGTGAVTGPGNAAALTPTHLRLPVYPPARCSYALSGQHNRLRYSLRAAKRQVFSEA